MRNMKTGKTHAKISDSVCNGLYSMNSKLLQLFFHGMSKD